MKNKIIVFTTLFLILFSSIIYANDIDSKIIDADVYTSEKDKTLLDNQVSGNVFDVSSDFELSASSTINGNLFVVAKNVSLKSDVTYSENLGKDNEPSIDKVNSSASISGNVYVVCNEFTMDSGVEINGDLYIVAKKIDIQKSSVVRGNVFATSDEFTLSGRVEHSVYLACDSFTTNYYSTIYRDLNLSANYVKLNSVIRRNATIDSNTIVTGADFLTYGNLDATSESFTYSGETDGNVKIISKELNFINTDNEKAVKCIIKGSLNYSSSNKIENIETFVSGEVTKTAYSSKEKNTKSKFSFKNFILELFTFIAYVFVISWLFLLLNKKHKNNILNIKVGNSFAALGIGGLAFIIVIILSILLFIINIGVMLGFALIVAYIFLLFISTPLFVLDIAIILKEKCSIYLGVLLLAILLFLVFQIPYLGAFISFLFTTIGCGRIILNILHNVKN